LSEEQSKEEPKESHVITPTAITSNGIAEVVWDRQTRPHFALKRFGSPEIEYVDEIESEEEDEEGRPIVYTPADGPALRKGLVLVPRRAIKGTFEETCEFGKHLAHEIYDTSKGREAEFDFLIAVAQASWFLDRFIPDSKLNIAGMGHFAPLISLRGPSGHGKNRALSALRLNSYRPFYDQSTKRIPSLFRPLDLWRGTLCLDECDLGKSDESSDVVHYLNCRAYGTPISRQNPDAPTQSQAFFNFGLTIDTQRRAWPDDALENRTLPFPCERSQKELATTELDEWLEKGLELQDRLLYLRLVHWNEVKIDKAARVPGLKDHRLTASVLPLLALREFAPKMVSGLEDILKVLARRRQEVRAMSSDGVVVNYLWERLDTGLIGIHNAFPFVGAERQKTEEGKDETVMPLQVSEMADTLKWSAREVRRIIGSLQITPENAPRHPIHVGKSTIRPIFFDVRKLEVLLGDFVIEYQEGTLDKRLQNVGVVTATLDTLATLPASLSPAGKEDPPTQAGTVSSVSSVANPATRQSVASVAESKEKKGSTKPKAHLIHPKCEDCGKELGKDDEPTVYMLGKKHYCKVHFEVRKAREPKKEDEDR
jgi:hypothetical protein